MSDVKANAVSKIAIRRRLETAGFNLLSQSINHALTRARTLATNGIHSELNLKKGTIRDKLTIRRATRNNAVGSLDSKKRGALLSSFPYKQLFRRGKEKTRVKAGIRVNQFRGKPADVITQGFLVPLKNGGGRQGIARRLPGEGRKYEVLKAPSVSQSFARIKTRISPEVQQIQRREFLRLSDVFINRKKGN